MTILDAKLSRPREGGPSFSLRHRLFRLLWSVVWVSFGRWTPVPLHGWRRFLLRMFGAKLDRTSKIYPGTNIWYPPNLTMAAYSCLAAHVNCYCMNKVHIGRFALISQNAHLCGGTHDVDQPDFQLVTKPIVILDNAWIAAEAFVGPGVTVGEGAVLGARAVAMRSLDAWTIYVGNPAKPHRRRREHVEMRGNPLMHHSDAL